MLLQGSDFYVQAIIERRCVCVCCRRLHCPRNTIHINMFVSFILRATISFVKENALVASVGFSFDVEYKSNGEVVFLDNGSVSQSRINVCIKRLNAIVTQTPHFKNRSYSFVNTRICFKMVL